MKTSVFIPDPLFERAGRLARRASKSRSQVFSEALRDYVARHDPDEVVHAINHVIEEVDGPPDEFVAAATRRTLKQIER